MVPEQNIKLSIGEITKALQAKVVVDKDQLKTPLTGIYASDLMSDVLAYCDDESVLITGLMNNQVIRTAEMLDLKAIVFVRGKKPNDAVIELAKENEIALIASHHSMYTAAGILFGKGLKGTKF